MGVSDTTEKDWEEHYQKILAEAEQKAMCESCIHKVSADDIAAIKNSAIDEFVDSLTCQACFTNMQKDAIRIYAEQLKESEK